MTNIEKSSADIKCPVFGICGGCDLQDKTYGEQLKLKQSWVLKALDGFGCRVAPIIASPQEFSYRSRITLHKQGEAIGFYKRASHEVVAIINCPLANDAVNLKLSRITAGEFKGKSELELRDDQSAGFTQVNTEQNKNLIKTVAEFVGVGKRLKILELYAGGGNLSFALAKDRGSVLAIEGDAAAVECARQRLKKPEQHESRKIKNISFCHSPVHDAVFELSQKLESFDVVVCDPPREGMTKTAPVLPRLKAQRIVYVSCEVNSFVKDARVLIDRGYALKEVVPLDMFPQTRHVEVVGLFEAI